MVNLLQLQDPKPGAGPAAAILRKHSTVLLGRLLRRAGHPIEFGQVAGDAVELWGLEGDAKWSTDGMIQIECLRDFDVRTL